MFILPLPQLLHGIDPGPSVFGVVHCIHDDPTHTDQQMYSCGSLAPKMRRGGCIDSHYHTPGEPWERMRGEGVCMHVVCGDEIECGMG